MSTATLKEDSSSFSDSPIILQVNPQSTLQGSLPQLFSMIRKELNMVKDYETFVEELKTGLKEIMGISEDNISFEKKGSEASLENDRLLVKYAEHKDAWEVCGIYPREIYKSYLLGADMGNILQEIADDISRIRKSDVYERTKDITDYEKSRKNLFIRLLNADKYADDLQNAVYKTIGDIALVLYMKVGECNNCITSTKIHNCIVRQWNKDPDEVFKEALLNTYFISPPRIYRWEKLIFDPNYEGENFMDLTHDIHLEKDTMGNCLSTSRKTNGAVAVFLPGVAQRLAYLLESDFYMVFTSIHEVMIHNDAVVEPEDLKNILMDTMKESTPEEDYLTSNIYHFSRSDNRFTCVTLK
ncbi:MAG: DUF5688 family protein [Blautia sp.]|nr:DUF5688 family protein [Blautia sp.]